MSAVGYDSTSEESANPTSATRSIASGRCRRKLRISDVARTSLDGSMSRARIDTDRSRTMMRSCRSYCGLARLHDHLRPRQGEDHGARKCDGCREHRGAGAGTGAPRQGEEPWRNR